MAMTKIGAENLAIGLHRCGRLDMNCYGGGVLPLMENWSVTVPEVPHGSWSLMAIGLMENEQTQAALL